jgi:predicted DNA binding CopG/RHH family protein
VARRRRGQGETVSLTIRLSRGDWERVHQLAVSEGVRIQTLMVLGLSKVFAEKGLPDLAS